MKLGNTNTRLLLGEPPSRLCLISSFFLSLEYMFGIFSNNRQNVSWLLSNVYSFYCTISILVIYVHRCILAVKSRTETYSQLMLKVICQQKDFSVVSVISESIYLSIGINVRFAAMMADVGDGPLWHIGGHSRTWKQPVTKRTRDQKKVSPLSLYSHYYYSRNGEPIAYCSITEGYSKYLLYCIVIRYRYALILLPVYRSSNRSIRSV